MAARLRTKRRVQHDTGPSRVTPSVLSLGRGYGVEELDLIVKFFDKQVFGYCLVWFGPIRSLTRPEQLLNHPRPLPNLVTYNVVCRQISTHQFGMAAVLPVTRPNCPLALLGTVFGYHATRADVQLRPGESFFTTFTVALFSELLPCGAVQLLQAGAREALGHEFDGVSAVASHQPVVDFCSPPIHHSDVGIRS